MTVSSSTNRVSYSGNGTLTAFAYTFKIFDEDDLTVILRASDGAETVQTITTHYTVSGVGDAGGGNVTFVTAPASGVTVVILREQPLTQGLDLVPNDPFPAASLEEALDKLVFMTQKHEEELGRAIKASRTNTLTGSEFTISAADRANKVFSFDSSGDLSVTQELGTFKGDWAASTAYVERDLVKDTTTNNVFIVTSAHTSSGSLPLTTNTNSDKYEKIIDITNPPGDVTFGGSITTSSSVTAGSFVIGSADINENDLEAIDEVIAGTVAASKAVVVDVNKDISSFRNLTATGDITFGSLSDGTITVTAFVDEDNMASDSATLVPTQQSVKAYVDAQVATADTLTEILGNGNTTSGANIQMTTTDELQFRDTALKISSSVDGQLDIDADTEVEITAPTVDINASTEVNISGAAKIGGTLNIDTINELTTDAGTTINSTFIGNNKIGIGTSVVGDTQVAIRGSAAKLRLESLTAGNHNWDIGVSTSNFRIYHQATGGNAFWIDSTDNVGIGTISPSTKLDVNGTITATGGAFTGDVSFGDNDKAIFGAGSDLQIYHDGSASYIDDQGEGPLKIKATDFRIKNAADTKNYFRADDGGAVSVYYDNNLKLATTSTGVDITGTLTSDGLTVDGTNDVALITTNQSNYTEGLTLRNTANYGYGTSLSFEAKPVIGGSTAEVGRIQSSWDSNLYHSLNFYTLNNNTLQQSLKIAGNGDISFYEDTGTTAKFFWDASAEALGIGTSSPATGGIHIAGDYASNKSDITLQNTNGGRTYRIGDGVGGHVGKLTFFDGTASAARMVIDSSGNVGIGTTSPDAKMHIASADSGANVSSGADELFLEGSGDSGLTIGSGSSSVGRISFADSGTNRIGALDYSHSDDSMRFSTGNGTERMRIDSSGNILLKTLGAALQWNNGYQTITGQSTANDLTYRTYQSHIFKNTTSASSTTDGTEVMRIDSSGNLLVGKTSTNTINTVGHDLTDHGEVMHTTDGGTTMYLNRKTSDGTIIDFRKDSTVVGSIASRGGVVSSIVLDPRTGGGGLGATGPGSLCATNNTGASTTDNVLDLGHSGARWKDVYVGGGVYLGGTGSANKLDDYEEGTFTVTIADAVSGGNVSSTTGAGIYTKIGKRVFVDVGIANISTAGMTSGNAIYFRGLPFTSDSPGIASHGVCKTDSVNFQASSAFLVAQVDDNATTVTLKQCQDNGVDTNTTVGDVTNGTGDVSFSISYATD